MSEHLIYINKIGNNHKGEFIYEFIFSKVLEVSGPEWERIPSDGHPLPPEQKYISCVDILKTEIEFELAQESKYFSLYDTMDDVIALGWEIYPDETVESSEKRLVFKFGELKKSVADKLYARDLILRESSKIDF